MFYDHPTAAEIAMSDDQGAVRKNKELEHRVRELELLVKHLMRRDAERGYSTSYGGLYSPTEIMELQKVKRD